MARVAMYLLGAPRIEQDGVLIEFDRRKAIALIAYLAVQQQPYRRDTLAALLWPDQDQTNARASLRRTLAALTAVIDSSHFDIDRESIGLNRNADLWIDVDQFHRLLDDGCANGRPVAEISPTSITPLAEAVALYQGDFMAGFSLRDSPEFDEWQLFQAESLRRSLAGALERLVWAYSMQDSFDAAISAARRWLQLDQLHEEAQRRLMLAYAWAGQPTAALRQYHDCVRTLNAELGVAPQDETTRLYDAIRSGRPPAPPRPHAITNGQARENDASLHKPIHPLAASGGPRRVRSLAASESEPPEPKPALRPQPLPAPMTPLIGREAELAFITQRLTDPTCRLVTLLGPGGVGKTRLALQTATNLRAAFQNQVYFVSLAALKPSSCLMCAIAQALGLAPNGHGEPGQFLVEVLRNQKALLALDNFEHLIAKAPQLVHLLEQAPNVKLLITSRERLRIQGEWTLDVRGLETPGADAIARAEEYSAVQLFVQSAQRTQADFVLRPEDRAAVVQICRLVSGIPLGIELASAWVRMLSCREIAQELESNLELLATSPRDLPTRHQSIRAVFDHSWDLLAEDERRVFRKLAVFQGGFHREAAEQVAEASLPRLVALVDKSLLRRNTNGRYEPHDLVRQYATERLEAVPPEYIETQERHGSYYLTLLRNRLLNTPTTQLGERVAELSAEGENVRAAWRWAITHRQTELIEQSILPIAHFYEKRGLFGESVKMLGEAANYLGSDDLQRTPPTPARQTLLGRVLVWQGSALRALGRYDQARSTLLRGMTLLREAGDGKEISAARKILAHLAIDTGEYSEAKQLLEANLAYFRLINEIPGIAATLNSLGYVAGELGDYTKAMFLLEESLTLCRSLDSADQPWRVANTLNSLGYLYGLIGDYEEATRKLQESIDLSKASKIGKCDAGTIINLGFVTVAHGDDQSARNYFYQALESATNVEWIPMILLAIVGVATTRVKADDKDQAIEHLAFALHHPASDQEAKDRARCILAELAAELPAEHVATAIERGKAKTYDSVVAEVWTLRG